MVQRNPWPDSARPRKTHDAGRTDHAALSESTRVVHIGDSLEDAAAASAVGAISVLVTGASLQPPDRVMLKQLQPFVASSLKQALQYAGGDGD